MLGIPELLNLDFPTAEGVLNDCLMPAGPSGSSSSDGLKSESPNSESSNGESPGALEKSTSTFSSGPDSPFERVPKPLCSRIHPRALRDTKLIDLALRRKSSTKRNSNPENFGLKLHLKLLEAGLRVRLIMCPSIYEIYNQITPITVQSASLHRVLFDETYGHLTTVDITPQIIENRRELLLGRESAPKDVDATAALLRPGKCSSKRIRLIDNNLVDLAGVSTKVLKSLTYDRKCPSNDTLGDPDNLSQELVSTFNMLDTAILSLFHTPTYLLVRVTKSASTNTDGSVLVKLETARPGDPRLIDDREFVEDMVASLGRPNQTPNNLFIKKVVARPRYKVDMKLYLTSNECPILLYVDPRAFERDLINGILDFDCAPDRHIYTTFPCDLIFSKMKLMLEESIDLCSSDDNEDVPNHMTEDLYQYLRKSPFSAGRKDEGSVSSSSSSLSPSVFSSTGSTSSASVI